MLALRARRYLLLPLCLLFLIGCLPRVVRGIAQLPIYYKVLILFDLMLLLWAVNVHLLHAWDIDIYSLLATPRDTAEAGRRSRLPTDGAVAAGTRPLDPSNPYGGWSYGNLYYLCGLFTVLLLLSLPLFWITRTIYGEEWAERIPALLYLVVLAWFVVPGRYVTGVGFAERGALRRALWRMVSGGRFSQVPLSDIILGDVLTSLSQVVGDLHLVVYDLFLDGLHMPALTSALIAQTSDAGADPSADTSAPTGPVGQFLAVVAIWLPCILISIPFAIRIRQCWSCYCIAGASASPVAVFTAVPTRDDRLYDEDADDAAKETAQLAYDPYTPSDRYYRAPHHGAATAASAAAMTAAAAAAPTPATTLTAAAAAASQRRHHLLNIIKYLTAFPVVWTAFYINNHQRVHASLPSLPNPGLGASQASWHLSHPDPTQPGTAQDGALRGVAAMPTGFWGLNAAAVVFYVWIGAQALNATYSFAWDVLVDWDLGHMQYWRRRRDGFAELRHAPLARTHTSDAWSSFESMPDEEMARVAPVPPPPPPPPRQAGASLSHTHGHARQAYTAATAAAAATPVKTPGTGLAPGSPLPSHRSTPRGARAGAATQGPEAYTVHAGGRRPPYPAPRMPLLRERRYFPTWVYVVCVVIDLVVRFGWIAKMDLMASDIGHVRRPGEEGLDALAADSGNPGGLAATADRILATRMYLDIVLKLAELLRRWMWVNLRLERSWSHAQASD
ncbi:hypothetical protein CXG81DRAFT_17698 [Caulochytrium protostelioides]|uniref:EXS domain-containing protein n=1 Tax=Caulochytrium protostelioides TaxID=1555241 RepID=A0A4P9XB90_9FUNG|nr:hypothetical protein CXG81DRAFT_17698 [Caulochytrium protostelioides]|eukprot:RKP02646.1 hypothetical protein CXG81DRAFT_17698 [Caulochytrium protostelioides]